MEKKSTEDKILDAAHHVFEQRGYDAAKMRDIAQTAGINLALVNYHFGSKEKLFKRIINEKFQLLLHGLQPMLSDEEVPLVAKLQKVVDSYTDLLLENENLPIFVLNELAVNKSMFEEVITQTRQMAQPIIDKQLREQGIEASSTDLVVNTLGLTLFPFVAKPLLTNSGVLQGITFEEFVRNRQTQIVNWIIKTIK